MPLTRHPACAAAVLAIALLAIPASPSRAQPPEPVRVSRLGTEDNLPSARITALAVGPKSIWVGTDRGLAEIREEGVRVQPGPPGLPRPFVTALAFDPDTGEVWMGTTRGLAWLSAGRWTHFTRLNSGLANDFVHAVCIVEQTVWTATANGVSAYHMGTDQWQVWTVTGPWPEPTCMALAGWPGGTVVAGFGNRLYMYLPGTSAGWHPWPARPSGPSGHEALQGPVTCIGTTPGQLLAAQGVAWVGTFDGLVRIRRDGTVTRIPLPAPLDKAVITCVLCSDEAVAVGTDRGFAGYAEGRGWTTVVRDQAGWRAVEWPPSSQGQPVDERSAATWWDVYVTAIAAGWWTSLLVGTTDGLYSISAEDSVPTTWPAKDSQP